MILVGSPLEPRYPWHSGGAPWNSESAGAPGGTLRDPRGYSFSFPLLFLSVCSFLTSDSRQTSHNAFSKKVTRAKKSTEFSFVVKSLEAKLPQCCFLKKLLEAKIHLCVCLSKSFEVKIPHCFFKMSLDEKIPLCFFQIKSLEPKIPQWLLFKSLEAKNPQCSFVVAKQNSYTAS